MTDVSVKRTQVQVSFSVRFNTHGASPLDAISATQMAPDDVFTDIDGNTLQCTCITATPIIEWGDVLSGIESVHVESWDVVATYKAPADEAEVTDQSTTD